MGVATPGVIIVGPLQAAKALHVPFELWCKGLLNQLDDTEEAELERLLRRNKDIKLVS